MVYPPDLFAILVVIGANSGLVTILVRDDLHNSNIVQLLHKGLPHRFTSIGFRTVELG